MQNKQSMQCLSCYDVVNRIDAINLAKGHIIQNISQKKNFQPRNDVVDVTMQP